MGPLYPSPLQSPPPSPPPNLLRLNKFYDLIGEMLKALFRLARRDNWDGENVEMVTNVLGQNVLRLVQLADVSQRCLF